MFEKIFKKQEKVQENVQEKIQKQQELNDKDCRELTDEELDQIVGGMRMQDQKNPVDDTAQVKPGPHMPPVTAP